MAQYVMTMNRVGKVVPPKRQILKDISLSFFPGAKIGVLGLNGAGKSTLLKIMAGVDTDIEGEIIWQTGLKIGYLPQEPQLDPNATVRQCVEEGMGEVMQAQAKLEEVYAAYAEPDADFDALAAEQARLEAMLPLKWILRPMRCAFRPGKQKLSTSRAAKSDVSRSAGFCCRALTCFFLTSRPTILMLRVWSGLNSSCIGSRALLWP